MWTRRHLPDRLPHPLDVLLPRPRVNHNQVVVRAQAVQHHVVHKRPFRRQHRAVVRLPHLQPARIVHQQLLARRQAARPAQLNAPHVAHVEHADSLAHRRVLRHQPGILHRHLPPAKIHHLCAQPLVRVEQRGPPQRVRHRRGFHRRGNRRIKGVLRRIQRQTHTRNGSSAPVRPPRTPLRLLRSLRACAYLPSFATHQRVPCTSPRRRGTIAPTAPALTSTPQTGVC